MCPEIFARSPGCEERGRRKAEHTWTYERIFGGTRDAAEWAHSRFLETSEQTGKNLDCVPGIVKRPGMHFRFPCLAALAWLLLRSPDPAYAGGTGNDNRLVVIESSSSGQLSKNAKEHLRQEIADVVKRKGITLVPSSTLPDRLLHCEIPGCLPQIAAASGATLVLHVEARFAKESFKLTIHLWNADEGKLLGKDGRNCPICDEQDLWGSAALLAQGLIEQGLRPPARGALLTPPPAAVVLAASPQAPRMTAPELPQPQGKSSDKLAEYSGFALAAAGLATLVAGSYYISVDGHSACFQCDKKRDTSKYGWPMALAGGVALLGGSGLVTWSLWPTHAQVAIGPAGLQLGGRFQ